MTAVFFLIGQNLVIGKSKVKLLRRRPRKLSNRKMKKKKRRKKSLTPMSWVILKIGLKLFLLMKKSQPSPQVARSSR